MRALGLDLGTKRIGVAISDSAGTVATPFGTVVRTRDRAADRRRIIDMADEIEAEVIVVGLPLHLDGRLSPAARSAMSEAKALGVAAGRPVETYDERLTTVTAERSLRDMNVRGPSRRNVIDQLAATVMLQSWLDHRFGERERDDDEPSSEQHQRG